MLGQDILRSFNKQKILPVYKPPGFSSYDLIRAFKKEINFRGKIGHGGTLDPFACGVVLLLLGGATRKFAEIKKWEKVYLAGIRLGATSTTQDIEGQIVGATRGSPVRLTPDKIKRVFKDFEGKIEQKIPAYSAAKYKGTPLYKLARQGRKIKKSKKVRIKKINLVFYKWPLLTIRVTTLGGAYIRKLAEDIGEQLGTGGFLYFLQRERIGKFKLGECISVQDFSKLKLVS